MVSDPMSKQNALATRRRALGIGSALVLGTVAAPAIARGAPRVLRMATSWPQGLRGLADSASRLAETITEGSRGSLEVRVGWAGAFVAPLSVHGAVGTGQVEMYHSAEYYFQHKHPALNYFTTVPFGLTTQEQAAWTRHGGGQALWDEINARFGVMALPAGGTGPQMLGWFAKDLKRLSDLEGLRVRMPGLASRVIAKLGAELINMPGAGIVQGLMTGTLDGTEWVGPFNDRDFGLHKLARNYYYPGFHEPGMMASLGIGLEVWDSLSADQQSLIQTAADAELALHTADYHGRNGLALAQMIREDGVSAQRLPDEIWSALALASREVLDDIAATDETARRIHDSYMAFRSLVGGSADICQDAYIERRGLRDMFRDV